MRQNMIVESASGLVPFGHMGWGFHDRSEFFDRAAEYIADGLRHDQYVFYVGAADRQELLAELAAMPQLAGMLDSGGIDAITAADYYVYLPDSDVLDVERAVAKYVATAHDAIAKGYSGFRAAVDVTTVARTAEQREALARLEFLVDKQMAVHPFSALCAYDIAELGPATAELLCLHPFISAGSVDFRLYADPKPGIDFALSGEIDASGNELFAATLRRLWSLTDSKTLHVDASDLRFISHRPLITLDAIAREQRSTVVMHTNQHVNSRLVDLLQLTAVRLERSPGHTDGEGVPAPSEQWIHLEPQPDDGCAVQLATEILMRRLGVNAEQALATLVRLSHGKGISKEDLAARMCDEGAADRDRLPR